MTKLINKNTANIHVDSIELKKSNRNYKYYRRGSFITKISNKYDNGVYELINSRTRQNLGLGLVVCGELYHAL